MMRIFGGDHAVLDVDHSVRVRIEFWGRFGWLWLPEEHLVTYLELRQADVSLVLGVGLHALLGLVVVLSRLVEDVWRWLPWARGRELCLNLAGEHEGCWRDFG